MTAFTKEIEAQIRDLGLSLKLQLDFAAAADMNRQADQLQLVQNNMRSAEKMIGLMKALNIPMAGDDAGILEKIAAIAENNGSDAGDLLKAQAPKVRAINTEVMALAAQNKAVSPDDLNRLFRKHLAPKP